MKTNITISHASKLCSVSRATIWRWIKSGKLKAAKTAGGHHRLDHDEFMAFMDHEQMHSQHRSGTRKKILIVDDDAMIRKYFKRLLDYPDIDLEFAKDGFEAGLKTAEFKPDLIILDLFMPEMDGFNVCRQIKESGKTAAIKIIAISGFDTHFNRKRILLCGADVFLAKPIAPEIMLKKVGELLNTDMMKAV